MKKLALILLVFLSLVSCSKEDIENSTDQQETEIVFKNNLPNIVYSHTNDNTNTAYFFFNDTTVVEWSVHIYDPNDTSYSEYTEYRGEYTYNSSTRIGTIVTEDNETVPFNMVSEDVLIKGIYYTPN